MKCFLAMTFHSMCLSKEVIERTWPQVDLRAHPGNWRLLSPSPWNVLPTIPEVGAVSRMQPWEGWGLRDLDLWQNPVKGTVRTFKMLAAATEICSSGGRLRQASYVSSLACSTCHPPVGVAVPVRSLRALWVRGQRRISAGELPGLPSHRTRANPSPPGSCVCFLTRGPTTA